MIYNSRLYLYTFVIFFSLVFVSSFAQDVESLKKQAKFNNDPEAWYQLGLTYEEGLVEKKSIKKATQYYEKAVIQNHPAAALHLAKIKEAKGETTEVIKLYNIAANGKNAEAHYILGKYYLKGQIVGKDQDQAIYHLLRAWDQDFKDAGELLKEADLDAYSNKNKDIFYQKYLGNSGNAQSEYALGLAYKNGDEVEKDLNKSFELLTKAAEKNHPEAQYELALFYKNGLLGSKDSRKAVALLLKSANNNNKDAIQLLSKMDVKTFVDPNNLDYVQYKALADNDAEAQYELYLLYANKANPSKEDELKKVEFLQRAALQDYQPAMLSLADLYFNGTPPLQKSTTSAFKWRRQAAYVGSDSAEYLLGNMYAMGEGVAQSEATAIKWYMKAANHGVYSAKVALKQYDISKYLDKSDLEYATYLANQGNLDAQLMLGKYYYKKEKISAIHWLSKAAGQNSAEAELYLGDIYKDGKCQTPQDLSKAEVHYKKAIALGNQDAYLKMAQLYAYQKNTTTEVTAASNQPEAMNYASQYMTRSVAVDSKNTDTNPEAYLIIADIQIQEENYFEAIKQYDLYIKSFDEANGNHKEFIDVLNKQAIAYASVDEVSSALLQIDIALAKSDDFSQLKGFKDDYSNIKGELFYTQATLLFQKGDKYKACNGFQKAKALGIKIESKYEDLCMN
ncbi:tetratricopeptide repeat protein [Flammeovirga sp. EKP202]|uniref:SEL1-like repeat protein n=1 Tax=Flammeovirga sp. EKP202 TaxID=2770592 RepID=UPI00165EFE9D|nr:tetratricopeptide repeat protein [Flammeovirga sp. EKP202]MBD0401251.1 sel1 repeat family protein [Flammeovirga sp. EKP202]